MCSSAVAPKAEVALAALLRDLCAALNPDDPGAVVIGPVDFGASGTPKPLLTSRHGGLTIAVVES